MRHIGAHVSVAGGIENAVINAVEIEANAFSMFTRNPRSWQSKPLAAENIAAFKKHIDEYGFEPQYILPHDSYLINIGSPKPEIRDKSLDALLDEVVRAEQLGVFGVNFHPGAHTNLISVTECIQLIADGVNNIISNTQNALLVIENTAGQGSTIGRTFEEIAEIIQHVENKQRVGVCLDTCHLFAAGYDIRTESGLRDTIKQFDDTVGLSYLVGMHLNDSKGTLGSHIDRHNSLGAGELGWDCFKHIIREPLIPDVPMILETIDPSMWKQEIAQLRSFE